MKAETKKSKKPAPSFHEAQEQELLETKSKKPEKKAAEKPAAPAQPPGTVKRYFVDVRANYPTYEKARALADSNVEAGKFLKKDERVRVRRRANGTFDVVVKTPRFVEVVAIPGGSK